MPQDYSQAVKWFRKAADQGQIIAQLNLGVMYANGDGVPQDYVLAYMWSSIAASNGQEGASMNRDAIAAAMTPRQIGKAKRLARDWEPGKE
jgi:TPR repeat protein